MISFIVSTYNRPWFLGICVASLALQEGRNEIIICDNSTQEYVPTNKRIAWTYDCTYLRTGAMAMPQTCYHQTSYTKPTGEWLCFPSDDSYYVPGFSRIMTETAVAHGWEFVYCDMLYDPRFAMATRNLPDTYSVMDVRPTSCSIDKTCFLITRRAFDLVGGWPEHHAGWCDGALAEAVVKAGIAHGKAPGVMVVHN